MNKGEIALDFDDVCVDTIKFKDIYFEQALGSGFETSHPDYQRARKELYSDIGASLEHLICHDGFHEAVDAFRTAGYGIRIVTNRSESSLVVAQKILEREKLSDIPIFGVGYGNSKLVHVKGSIAFVDDDPRNFSDMFGVIPNLFLMSTSENTEYADNRLLRVNNLNELVVYILREG